MCVQLQHVFASVGMRFWKEERELIMNKNVEGKRPCDVGSVYMGYRLDSPKTGRITRAMIYPKGAFILHMIRMMMWDKTTGDQRFKPFITDRRRLERIQQ